jgi:hypothetical protein
LASAKVAEAFLDVGTDRVGADGGAVAVVDLGAGGRAEQRDQFLRDARAGVDEQEILDQFGVADGGQPVEEVLVVVAADAGDRGEAVLHDRLHPARAFGAQREPGSR